MKREVALIALVEFRIFVHALTVLLPRGKAFKLANLVDTASRVRTNPDFPSADQHGSMSFKRAHGFALKGNVAFNQAPAARNNQSVLINHIEFSSTVP